ncbi:MAG: UDP-2,4-diacetamido-2,4,6-trideoxy-beta-L-altropyranose hydrolase [Verrucomicrobiota bacterium]
MKIAIRSDASPEIGTGHVMRMLALAQYLKKRGADVYFMSYELPDALRQRLHAEGLSVVAISEEPGSIGDAQRVIRHGKENCTTWTIVDGYHFKSEYQNAFRSNGMRVLFLDDYVHCERYSADVVLNQNCYADRSLGYCAESADTKFLMGAQFALLRDEFRSRKAPEREFNESISHVLVTLGGADPDNGTQKILEILEAVTEHQLEIKVIIGGANPHVEPLAAFIKKSRHRSSLVTSVTDMWELMDWADMAITAAGTTTMELCYMGLPSLVCVLADNQLRVVKKLEDLGIVQSLGDIRIWDEQDAYSKLVLFLENRSLRKEMGGRGSALVDGAGVSRVYKTLLEEAVSLREACISDERQVWEWANDALVREMSFNQAEILWKDHQNWYRQQLKSAEVLFYIASDDDGPLGQVRFTKTGDHSVISMSLASRARGKGLGSCLIHKATVEYFNKLAVDEVIGYVKTNNAPSLNSFRQAGYDQTEESSSSDNNVVTFRARRNSFHETTI